MSDRQWVQDIRHVQSVLSLPFGLGYTIDITQTLTALAAAGMPARVEAFDRLQFDDGRTAFLATPDPTTTVIDGDAAGGRSDDVILLPGGSEGGVLSLVRRYPDLVVVNGKRGRVWADGRQVHGTSMQREATSGWRTVFAIARSIVMHGGGTHAIADRTGIPFDDVRAAMPALGSHVFHTPIGWEATDRPALVDWALAAYPGYGGVRTCWRRDATIDVQADQLISLGAVMSDRWAAQQSGVFVPPDRLTAFFAEHPDVQALGYEPASADHATVKVVIPQDATTLTSAEGCSTDDFITAHVIYEDSWVTANTDAVNGLRQLLHFRSDLAHDLRWHPNKGSGEGRGGLMLQLLSLTLAYDDTRFFGSVMFTEPDHPDDPPPTILIDHADEPPWFRLTNVDATEQDPSVPAMVEADRIMRFLLRYTPERIGRTPADFPQP